MDHLEIIEDGVGSLNGSWDKMQKPFLTSHRSENNQLSLFAR